MAAPVKAAACVLAAIIRPFLEIGVANWQESRAGCSAGITHAPNQSDLRAGDLPRLPKCAFGRSGRVLGRHPHALLMERSSCRTRTEWLLRLARQVIRTDFFVFHPNGPANESERTRFLEILQRGVNCLPRVRPFGSHQMATAPHGARLADGSSPRLHRGHVNRLARLAPAIRRRGNLAPRS
jgi:hypothetical protein